MNTLGFLLLAAAMTQAPATDKWDSATALYTFLHEGETVQINIEHGHVSGYVTRKENGTQVDQKFESAVLEGDRLTWSTRPMHGTYFSFDGQISHDPNASKDKRGFYKIRGTVTTHKRGNASEKQLTMQSLPESLQAQ